MPGLTSTVLSEAWTTRTVTSPDSGWFCRLRNSFTRFSRNVPSLVDGSPRNLQVQEKPRCTFITISQISIPYLISAFSILARLSRTQWPSIWANSGRQWSTGEPGVLQSKGSQRDGLNNNTPEQQKTAQASISRTKTTATPSQLKRSHRAKCRPYTKLRESLTGWQFWPLSGNVLNKKNTSALFYTLLGVSNFTPKRILQFNFKYIMEKLYVV